MSRALLLSIILQIEQKVKAKECRSITKKEADTNASASLICPVVSVGQEKSVIPKNYLISHSPPTSFS